MQYCKLFIIRDILYKYALGNCLVPAIAGEENIFVSLMSAITFKFPSQNGRLAGVVLCNDVLFVFEPSYKYMFFIIDINDGPLL